MPASQTSLTSTRVQFPSRETYENVCGGGGGRGGRGEGGNRSFTDTASMIKCDFAERMSKQGSYYTPQSMQ